MEGWHQGRPLTAEGHVHGAKIGHHVDAGQCRQQGRVADLQGKAEGRAVAYGLAVTADGANLLGSQRRLGEQGLGGGGKFAGHQVVGDPHAVDFVLPRGAEGVQLVGGLRWPGMAQRRLYSKRFPIHRHQHGVDTIHAGTGHQAYIAFRHDNPLSMMQRNGSIPCSALVPDINRIYGPLMTSPLQWCRGTV